MKIKPTRDRGVTMELGVDEPAIPGTCAEPERTLGRLFKIRRILVPIDFSTCSKKALQYAMPFARQFGARICLLYVGQSYYLFPELALLELGAHHPSQRADVAGKLASFATQEIPSDIPVDILVRIGLPAVEIADAAREVRADLIIISTHGYTGVKHVWFGSVAEQLAPRATCPVLVVREAENDFLVESPLP